MPEFICVRCCECGSAQSIQRPKSRKFACRLCALKQSVRHVYAVSFSAAEIRTIVMALNAQRAQREQQDEEHAVSQAQQEQGDEEDDGEDDERELEEQEDAAAAHTGELNTYHSAPRVDWSVFAADEAPAPPSHARMNGSASVNPTGYSFGQLQQTTSPAASPYSPARSRAPKRTRASPARPPLRALDNASAAASADHWSAAPHSFAAASLCVVAPPAALPGGGGTSITPGSRWSAFFEDDDAETSNSSGSGTQWPPTKLRRVDTSAAMPSNGSSGGFAFAGKDDLHSGGNSSLSAAPPPQRPLTGQLQPLGSSQTVTRTAATPSNIWKQGHAFQVSSAARNDAAAAPSVTSPSLAAPPPPPPVAAVSSQLPRLSFSSSDWDSGIQAPPSAASRSQAPALASSTVPPRASLWSAFAEE